MLYINLIILIFLCCDLLVKNNSIQIKKPKTYQWNLYLLLYVYLKLFGDSFFKTPIVDVTQGGVVGRLSYGNAYNAYLGIPYASFHERFKAPKPPKKWDHVYEATTEGARCAQITLFKMILGSEDCLFLNVYTPVYAERGNRLPVMVFIHGGGYAYGSGSRLLYSPEFLVKQNVIVVTMNYRLGALGFLCLGIEGAPGNAGLKDQLAALKWVKRNIAAFGGDEENITLFGESAGASSTSFHMLSPKSKGLFDKAIIQSGSALAPWSFIFDPIQKAAEEVNDSSVDLSNPEQILQYYQKASTRQLVSLSGSTDLTKVPFKACVEPNIDRYEPFLTESPLSILISGNFTKVPLIAGFNDAEGLFFESAKLAHLILSPDFSNINLRNEDDANNVYKKAASFYQIDNSEKGRVDYFSDVLVVAPLIRFIREIQSHTDEPLYNYIFKYNGMRNFAKLIRNPRYHGASHGDDLFYLFQINPLFWSPNSADQLIINRMTTMWTNFAKYGDPTLEANRIRDKLIEWIPSTKTHLNFLEIDTEFKMTDLPIQERINFWDEVYKDHQMRH